MLRKVVDKAQKEVSELKPTFDLIFWVTDIFSLPETARVGFRIVGIRAAGEAVVGAPDVGAILMSLPPHLMHSVVLEMFFLPVSPWVRHCLVYTFQRQQDGVYTSEHNEASHRSPLCSLQLMAPQLIFQTPKLFSPLFFFSFLSFLAPTVYRCSHVHIALSTNSAPVGTQIPARVPAEVRAD